MNHRSRLSGPLVSPAALISFIISRSSTGAQPPGLDAVGARAGPEFGAERPDEIGHVTEATIERDVENLGPLCSQARGCFPEPRSKQILMRRQPPSTAGIYGGNDSC